MRNSHLRNANIIINWGSFMDEMIKKNQQKFSELKKLNLPLGQNDILMIEAWQKDHFSEK